MRIMSVVLRHLKRPLDLDIGTKARTRCSAGEKRGFPTPFRVPTWPLTITFEA